MIAIEKALKEAMVRSGTAREVIAIVSIDFIVACFKENYPFQLCEINC